MKTPSMLPSFQDTNNGQKISSAESILKLRRLISDLINQVDLLDSSYLPVIQPCFGEDSDSICFYEEVERFEIALIRAALKRSHGNQLRAAQLLNLNPSTLNSKIKQYKLRQLWSGVHAVDWRD